MRIIKFDGKELKVDSLKTTIKPAVGITNMLVARSRSLSKRFAGYDSSAKLITLYFPISHRSFNATIEEIGSFFYTENLAQLLNPRDETRFFMAKLEGEIDYQEDGNIVYCTVPLIAPLGLSQAVDKESFPFEMTDDGTSATIVNAGTYKAPVDINVKFLSDANSIGFITGEKIMQLGTAVSEDDGNVVPSTKVSNDDMGTGTKNLWSTNVGRVRWRYESGDNTSKIMGSLSWAETSVTPSSYGSIDASKPGYWHGPTLTRNLTTPLTDFEAYHRVSFKANGTKAQRPTCQGLLEINYSDSDNHFVIGFEMKDNNNKTDQVSYSFFIGDYRMYTGYLPKTVLEKNGGFFGAVFMKKVGNTFTFRLARINTTTWKEEWSSPTKSWVNNTVAMLPVSVINMFLSKWKADRQMTIEVTHTRITMFNSSDEKLIPKVFYQGDVINVDGQSNRVYINGIRDDSYRVIGSSQIFSVDPGDTEVVVISDGVISGEVSMRRRYV